VNVGLDGAEETVDGALHVAGEALSGGESSTSLGLGHGGNIDHGGNRGLDNTLEDALDVGSSVGSGLSSGGNSDLSGSFSLGGSGNGTLDSGLSLFLGGESSLSGGVDVSGSLGDGGGVVSMLGTTSNVGGKFSRGFEGEGGLEGGLDRA